MIAFREIKNVVNGKVTIDVPEKFGNKVEVIVLSEKEIEYWSEEEIKLMGSTVQKRDIDQENYST